jgi:hypothetical protein
VVVREDFPLLRFTLGAKRSTLSGQHNIEAYNGFHIGIHRQAADETQ